MNLDGLGFFGFTTAPQAAQHHYGGHSSWNKPWRPWQWNKWPKKEHADADWKSRGSGQGHQGQEQEQAPERYDLREATAQEVRAAAAKKQQGAGPDEAEPDDRAGDEAYLASLWEAARLNAWQDPGRPLSARELVQKGLLEPWWTYKWAAIADRFPETEQYRALLEGLDVKVPAQSVRNSPVEVRQLFCN